MFRRSIHRYRLRVIRVQRMVRGYIACSKARIQLLERLWTTVEADLRREAAKDVVKCRRLNSHVSHLQKLAKSDPFVQALRRASAAVQASQQYVTTAADVPEAELQGQSRRKPTGAPAAPEHAVGIGGSGDAGARTAKANSRRASIAEEIPVSRQSLAILPPGTRSTHRASGAKRETTRLPAMSAAATKRRSSFSGALQRHHGVGGVDQPGREDVAGLRFTRRPSAADSTMQDLLDRSQVRH